jgi:anaerobic selenocysteine-containing dehydrogenase
LAEDIRAAARLLARAERAAIVYSMGTTQHTTDADNVPALANFTSPSRLIKPTKTRYHRRYNRSLLKSAILSIMEYMILEDGVA